MNRCLLTFVCPIAPAHMNFLPLAVENFVAQQAGSVQMLAWFNGAVYRLHRKLERCTELVHDSMSQDGLSIGEIRNGLNALVDSPYIAHFDVDDWYGPKHVINLLLAHAPDHVRVAGYTSALAYYTEERRAQRFEGASNANIGASLLYETGWWEHHRFTDRSRGEDADFINAAVLAGVWAGVDGGHDFVFRTHPHCSSGRRERVNNTEWSDVPLDELPAAFLRQEETRIPCPSTTSPDAK